MIHFTNGKTDHNLKSITFEEIAESIISEFYAKVEKDNRKQFIIGEYKNSYWNLGNFIQSEYIILDVDHCGNERATQIRNDLKENKNIFLASISTSKDGLKIILKLSEPVKDFETLKTVHNYYAKEIENKYKVKIDRMPFSIISSFFLADKDCFFNPKCNTVKPCRLELSKSDEKKTISKTGKTKEFNPESFLNTHNRTMENLTNEISWQKPLISLPDNTGIVFEGTINTIEGFSGVHKSRLAESFISTLIMKPDASSILGLIGTKEPVNVILIDTERHFRTQFRYAIQNIFRNAGYDLNEPLPENFFSYSLIDVDFEHRRKALETAISEAKNKYPERHIIIFLDVITDMMEDSNSTPEASDFVQYLNRLVNEENCTATALIHENMKGLATGHATGAIGTALTRKATNIIGIKKIADNHFNIEFKKTRLTATPKKIAIKYDADIKQLVLLTDAELSDGLYKSNTKEIKEFLIDRLSKSNISRKEMLFLFEQNFNIRNDRTMEDRINLINQTDMYLQIEKIPIGREVFYSLKYNTELCDVI